MEGMSGEVLVFGFWFFRGIFREVRKPLGEDFLRSV